MATVARQGARLASLALTICGIAGLGLLPPAQAQCPAPDSRRAQTLAYTFEPVVRDGKTALQVVLEFFGGPTGTDELELPSEWGGSAHLEAAITGLQTLSPEVTLFDTADPARKQVRFPPRTLVRIRYDLVKDWSGPLRDAVRHRPDLSANYLQINTNNALIHPSFGQTTPVHVTFDWQKLPASWSLVTSFGAEARCQRYDGPWYAVQNALFTAGDFRLHRTTIAGQPLLIAIRGQWPFPDSEAVNQVQTLIGVEREFWRDHRFPYFLVTIAQLEREGGSTGGSAFTNAFAMYCSPNAKFSYGVQSLLAHEIFHTWNPYRLGRMPDAGRTLYWFSEGFSTYYQDIMLLRAGLLSFPDFLSRTNVLLRDYWRSPAKNISAAQFVERIRSDQSIARLPYLRGAVIALWLDWQIRQSTGGRATLDTMMLAMARKRTIRTRRASDLPLDNARIFRAAAKYIPAEASSQFRRYVEDGAAVEIPPTALGPCASLSLDPIPSFDLGFDRTALVEQQIIASIKPESKAYEAGVRDGDRVAGMSIYWDDPSQPVKLTLRSTGGTRRVEYMPHGPGLDKVPQFHLTDTRVTSAPQNCATYFVPPIAR